MQTAYYISLGSISWIIHILSSQTFNISILWNGDAIVISTLQGKIMAASHVASCILWYVKEEWRKVDNKRKKKKKNEMQMIRNEEEERQTEIWRIYVRE